MECSNTAGGSFGNTTILETGLAVSAQVEHLQPSDPATPLSGVPNRDANMFHHKTPQECSQQHYV